MGFVAAEKVSPLDYDFRNIEVKDEDAQKLLNTARGTTPEPSFDQYRDFQGKRRELLDLSADTSPDEIVKVLGGLSEEQWREIDEDMLDMTSALTSQEPSREELAALPFRVRQSYYGWLQSELNNPTGGTSKGSRRSLVPVKND